MRKLFLSLFCMIFCSAAVFGGGRRMAFFLEKNSKVDVIGIEYSIPLDTYRPFAGIGFSGYYSEVIFMQDMTYCYQLYYFGMSKMLKNNMEIRFAINGITLQNIDWYHSPWSGYNVAFIKTFEFIEMEFGYESIKENIYNLSALRYDNFELINSAYMRIKTYWDF